MVVIAEHIAAPQHNDILEPTQFGQYLLQPLIGRLVIDALAGAQQVATKLALIVSDDHPRTCACGDQGRHKAGWSGTDDQDVAVRILMLVVVGVGFPRCLAEACGETNEPLVILP